jgi:hypothetical protein
MNNLSIGMQIIWLLVLAIPIACVSWTITHEEIFRDIREWCMRRHRKSHSVIAKKFYYMFTCEYCFSHYVTIVALAVTQYTLLLPDWRGYIIAGFALVWVANVYMNLATKIRVDINSERKDIQLKEMQIDETNGR